MSRGDETGQHVKGFKESADKVAVNRQISLAQMVEQVFQDMREVANVVEAKCTARSLDAVCCAKDLIEQFFIVGLRFDSQQRSLHGL